MFCEKFSKKKFVLGNVLYILVLFILLLVSRFMENSASFIQGLLSGYILVWVIYIIFGLRELRKPSYATDERFQMIITRSASLTLGIVILFLAFFIIMLFSNWLVITIPLKDFCAMLLFGIMILNLVIYLIMNKLH